jgi:glycosyltransferase involved in cell wall biosynthesis
MPIALIEAQLAGLPVIATDVGSNSEVVKNEVTGFVIKNNPAEFETALKRLLSDKKMVRRMGANAKNRATVNFNLTKMVEAHLTTYQKLIN